MAVPEEELHEVDKEIIEDLTKARELLKAYPHGSEYGLERAWVIRHLKDSIMLLRNIPGKELS